MNSKIIKSFCFITEHIQTKSLVKPKAFKSKTLSNYKPHYRQHMYV